MLSACASYAPPAVTDRAGGVLTMAIDAYPTSLNPLVAGDVSSVRAYTPLFPHLYGLDRSMRLEPDLALDAPETVDGGRTWVVHLRPGASWSDGSPLDARDVVYTVNTQRSPSLDTHSTFDWKGLLDVTADSPTDVRFHLALPDASFPGNHLALAIVPRHVLAGTAPERMSGNVFGSRPGVSGGPFKLRDALAPTELDYEVNPHYYGRRPNLAQVRIVVRRDASLVVAQLSSGSLLWVPGMTSSAAEAARDVTSVRVGAYQDMGFYALAFNQRPGRLFAPIEMRTALAAALDRPAIAALGGHSVPVYGDIPADSWAYDASAVPPGQRDPARVAALLAGAGWSRPAGNVAVRAGLPLAARLLYPEGDAHRASAAALIRRQAAAVGFDLVPEVVAPATLAARLQAGTFDLALIAQGLAPDPDNWRLLHTSSMTVGEGLNYGGYSDPIMDRLLEQDLASASSSPDASRATRRSILRQVEQRLAEQVPFLPLWADLRYQGFNETVQGAGSVGNHMDQGRNSAFLASLFLSA
jgi:peptide/nickel transport system substrate-binding protein